ncbi:MAG: hypothetical protein J1F18_07520 [Lachnospiraceae bacterium]|nr:hypothetical protein [Lachnospiraceae bacterium]
MNKFINMLSKINGGNLIDGQENSDIEINLNSKVSKLFVDRFDEKYYFFAEYLTDGNRDNWKQIQDDTVNNVEVFGESKPNPSDSYLILLWKIDRVDDVTYSKIIDIEENVFFYKKYVLYYTQEEYDALNEWVAKNGNMNIEKVLEILSDEADEMPLYAKLLVRVITKIPFWDLKFPSAVLEDFEHIVDVKISNMRNASKTEVQEMKKIIVNNYNDANILADTIFSEYLKEWC